jgi:hypothetical protein
MNDCFDRPLIFALKTGKRSSFCPDIPLFDHPREKSQLCVI